MCIAATVPKVTSAQVALSSALVCPPHLAADMVPVLQLAAVCAMLDGLLAAPATTVALQLPLILTTVVHAAKRACLTLLTV